MKNKSQEKKSYRLFIALVTLYVLVQPLLDIYKSLVKVKLEICGISIIEIVNLILISALVILTFVNNKEEIWNMIKQKKIIIFIFCFGYFLYFFLHVFNILQFNSTIFPKNNISTFVELYYIFRALLEPLIFMLCLYIYKIPKSVFYTIITFLTIMVSGLIVVSNIFNFSLISYSGTNEYITSNIFSWFHYASSNTDVLTSRGLFSSANELSNLFLILLPINIYRCIKDRKFLYYLVCFIQIISMLMLGTKTATLGAVVILIGTLFLMIIISIKEEIGFKNYFKKTLPFLGMYGVFFGITLYSPLFLSYRNAAPVPIVEEKPPKPSEVTGDKNSDDDYFTWNEFKDLDCKNLSLSDTEKAVNYMNFFNYYHKVDIFYIETYPIEQDPVFWCDIYQQQMGNNMGNRMLKTAVFARVMELNNRSMDKFFGLGYTLDMLNLETDYYYLYYQFGLFGLLVFVGPYIGLFIISLVYFFKNLKKQFTYENVLLFVSVFCGLASPHVSGHLYGILFITLPLSLIIIMLYFCLKGENE